MAEPQPGAGPGSEAVAKWNAELAFRSVVEATADKAGLDFMRHLVKNLAQSLGVAYAFVAEFADAEDRVKTIAFWSGDDWGENIEFTLKGTPCERVVAGELCLYKDDIQSSSPIDTGLVDLGARSYLGVPLRGANGQALGHLAALDTAADRRGPARASTHVPGVREPRPRRDGAAARRGGAAARLRRARGAPRERPARTSPSPARASTSPTASSGAARDQPVVGPPPAPRRPVQRARALRASRSSPASASASRCRRGRSRLQVHVLALDQPSRGPMIEDFPSAGTACRWAQEQPPAATSPARAPSCASASR